MKKHLIYIFCLVLLVACDKTQEQEKSTKKTSSTQIPFRKDGSLTFLSASGDTIQYINIEIADNEAERTQGLMNRSSLPAESGMLFIFEEEDPNLAFWMRNTLISLDVIFVNAQKEVVDIAKFTLPQSDEPIPSKAPAQYVVEVVAGFTDTHQIQVGSKVRW
jgi:hypothetical protein